MQVSNPAATGHALLLASAKAVAARFQVGQILQALVLSSSHQNRVALELNGQRLNAATDLPLRQGQTIDVQVERARNPVLLRVLPEAQGRAEVERQALRTALPRQADLGPLLANLQVAAAGGSERGEVARALASAATRLLNTLPTPQQLSTPQGLKEALRHSGAFFEAGLSQAVSARTPPPQGDIKAQLLRLLAVLSRPAAQAPAAQQPAAASPPPAARGGAEASPGGERQAATPPRAESSPPPLRGRPTTAQASAPPSITAGMAPERVAAELRQQVEGALSRVQLHQLSSLPAEDGSRSLWSLELPVRTTDGTDVLALRIAREGQASGEGGGEESWTVELGFDLEGLGPLTTRLTLRGGQVSAVLWAEDPTAVAMIQSRMEELRRDLESAGLAVGRLGLYEGRPPAEPADGAGVARLLSITA